MSYLNQRLRERIGTLLLDRPRFAWVVLFPRVARLLRRSWVELHNRGEKLIWAEDGFGCDCGWLWTSDLTVCRSWPSISARLMEAALSDWPIQLPERSASTFSGRPVISFIIGHRGRDKIAHLQLTLRSLLAQDYPSVECVVVEQTCQPVLPEVLPDGVKHVHSRPPAADMPFARAWAFNVGARAAQGDILVFHDNDLLAPVGYATELHRVFSRGYKVARLQRFIFYLSEQDTQSTCEQKRLPARVYPLMARQNCEGGTLAVDRETYFQVGGHDETFIGWGGEDNEMFDRCRSRRCYVFGYLPFLHLYHPPQPTKSDTEQVTAHLHKRLAVPTEARIQQLTSRGFGRASGPHGYVSGTDGGAT